MTRGDIEKQEGNPDLVEDLCKRMIKEVRMPNFSLAYLREKSERLQSFLERLNEEI